MNSTRNTLTTVLLLGAWTVRVGPTMAQPLPELEGDQPEAAAPLDVHDAIELYHSARYADCVRAFSDLLSGRRIAESEIQRARYYHIACLIGAGRGKEADEQIRAAVRADPMLYPDRREFPPRVVDRFIQVRNGMIEEIERLQRQRIEAAKKAAEVQRKAQAKQRERLERLRGLATEETVIQRNSRWLAAVPFGVGQFQNHDRGLGYVFLTGEGLLLGTWLAAVAVELTLVSQADDPNKDIDVLNARLDSWRTVDTVAGWTLLGVAAAGVVEAQLSFEPEFRTTRKRRLPRDLAVENRSAPAGSSSSSLGLVPTAVPVAGGAVAGVGGRF